MHPHPAEEVVFREAYAAQGEAAPVYLVAGKWQGRASIYPKDPRQRTYPPHDPAALCPPCHDDVPLERLRHIKSAQQDALRQAVSEGKYRTIAKLLREHPLLDPHGQQDLPSLFQAMDIPDMKRWRKTVEVLVRYGAKLDHRLAQSHCQHWTLAHQAVHARQYEKLDALAGMGVSLRPAGADLDLLDLAIRRQDFDAIGALFLRGLASEGLRGRTQELSSFYTRYDRDTYRPAPLGMMLPLPHRALLQGHMQPAHLDAFRQALGEDEWNNTRDDHGRTAMEMAHYLGGEVLDRALPLQSSIQHDALQSLVSPPLRANAALGRRL